MIAKVERVLKAISQWEQQQTRHKQHLQNPRLIMDSSRGHRDVEWRLGIGGVYIFALHNKSGVLWSVYFYVLQYVSINILWEKACVKDVVFFSQRQK